MIALMEVMNPEFLNANEGLSAQNIITKSILEPGNTGLKMLPGNLINPDDVLANINIEKLRSLAEINPDILRNIVIEFYSNYTNEFLDTLVKSKGMESIVTDLLSDSFKIDKVDNQMKKLFNITSDDIDKSTYTKDVLKVIRERWGDTIATYNGGKGLDLRSMNISGQRLANAFEGIRTEEGDDWLQNEMVSFFMSAFGINPDTAMSMFDVDLFDSTSSSKILDAQKIKMARKANNNVRTRSPRVFSKSTLGTSMGDDDATMDMLRNHEKINFLHLGSDVNQSIEAQYDNILREIDDIQNEIDDIDADIRNGSASNEDYQRYKELLDIKDDLEAKSRELAGSSEVEGGREGGGYYGISGDESRGYEQSVTFDQYDEADFSSVIGENEYVTLDDPRAFARQGGKYGGANTLGGARSRLPDYEKGRLEYMYDPYERDQLSNTALPTSISALILGVQAIANAEEENLEERRRIRANQEEAISNAKKNVEQVQKDLGQENGEIKRGAAITREMVIGTVSGYHNPVREALYERLKSGKLVKAEYEALSGISVNKTDGTSDIYTELFDENGERLDNKDQFAALSKVMDLDSLPNEEFAKYSPVMEALMDIYSANPMLQLYARYTNDSETISAMRKRMEMYGGKGGSFFEMARNMDEASLYAAYYDMVDAISNLEGRYIGNVDTSMLEDKDVQNKRDYFDPDKIGIFGKRRSVMRTRKAVFTPEERGKNAATNIKNSITRGVGYLSISADEQMYNEEMKIRRKYDKQHKEELKRIDALSDEDMLKEAGGVDQLDQYLVQSKAKKEFEKLAKNGGSNPAAIMAEATRRGQIYAARDKAIADMKHRVLVDGQAKEITEMQEGMEKDPDYLAKKYGYQPNKMMSMARRGLDRTANFFGNRMVNDETYTQYISSVDGFSKKLKSAQDYLGGFQSVVQKVAEVFPPLQVAVVGLTVAIEVLRNVELMSAGLSKFMKMGRTLGRGRSISIFKGLTESGKGFKITPNSRLGKIIGGSSSMLGRVGSAIAGAAGPIAIVAAIIIALAAALKVSFESHKKYVETLKKEQKELQSRARSLEQQTYILKRQADRTSNEQVKLRMMKQLEVAEKKLINVQKQRRANTINLAMANEDALNGETGFWYKITQLWGGGQSHIAEREGLYATTQKAHEWAEGDFFGLFTTDAIQAVSDLKTASPFEFQAMENYGTELKSLYDMQSKAIKRTGSYEAAENDPAYRRRKERIMNQTGLKEEEVDKLLENMQTEHQVSQAKKAMEAQRDSVKSEHEIKRAAARMGVNPQELEAMKGTKQYQQLMIQAQADMIQQEEKGAAFMAIIKDLGMNVLIEIGAILKSLWDLFVIITSLLNPDWWILVIKAAVWGTDDWKQEDLDMLEAPSKAAEDIVANASRMKGAVDATWEDIDYAATVSDNNYNKELMNAANEVYDENSRGNFGHGPKNMYYMGSGGSSGVYGGQYMPGTESQSNSAKTVGSTNTQNQVGSSAKNQTTASNNATANINNNTSSLTASQKRVVSAGTTKTPIVGNTTTLSPKSSAINDTTTPNVGHVVEQKNTDNSHTDNSNNVTIQTININTDDDPEAIKEMFLELIIELQEQINPRLVSRTVGEPKTADTTNTDSSSSNTDTNSVDTSSNASGSSSNNSSNNSSANYPSASAIQNHRSTNKGNNVLKTNNQQNKSNKIVKGYDIVRKQLFNPNR